MSRKHLSLYKASLVNLFFAIIFLIYNLLTAGNRYVDTTPNSSLEGFYNLFVKGNALLPVLVVYLGLSVVLVIYQKRFRPST